MPSSRPMGLSFGRILVARVAAATAAALLFAVQPLAGRLVLPAFGGGPGTWAATLAFFQLGLLAGYAYAHLVATRLGPRRGGLLHLGLAVLAVGVALLAPAEPAALRPPGLEPALAVLVVHAATIGPTVVLLAATTPLLTGWLATDRLRPLRAGDLTGDRHGSTESPPLHRLYAFSNGGALCALLLYPLVVEPNLGLADARRLWLLGLAGFAILVGGIALEGTLRRTTDGDATEEPAGRAAPPPEPTDGQAEPAQPDLARTGRWLLLAAVPAGLLNALTLLLTLDLGAVPLLWVLPLAVYLGTFVLAFSALGDRLRGPVTRLAPIAATLLWLPLAAEAPWSVLPLLGVILGGLFVVALALHAALAAARPQDRELSGYYLALAAGGALGGSFVGIAAPLLFPDLWELPILLVAAILVGGWPVGTSPVGGAGEGGQGGGVAGRAATATASRPTATASRPAWFDSAVWRLNRYVIVGVMVLVALVADGAPAADPAILWFLAGAVVLAAGGRPLLFAAATGAVLAAALTLTPQPDLFAGRSFFGVLEVRPSPDRSVVQLWNGTTLHGTQPTDPARRLQPTGYYVEAGPAGDLFRVLRGQGVNGAGGNETSPAARGLAVGVVGLGVGGLAAYAEPGDAWTFVEVDPLVVRIARDPRLFTYLASARAPVDVVVDDGRLALARTTSASFDLLVLDAFTSDAVPVHLITAEAIADALRTVRPDGLLAAQLSNRYYDLVPAVAGAAELAGAEVLVRDFRPTAAQVATGAFPSRWLVAGRPGPALDALAAAGWTRVVGAPPLTDDRPNLLRFLRWSFG